MKPLSAFRFGSRSLLVTMLSIGCLGGVEAAIRTVTDASDNPASPAPGSLRGVIQAADPDDTIEFAPGVSGTILLGGAELLIDKNLTIAGPGAASLAISGNGASRIFRINWGKVVSVSGLTIRDGQAPHGTDGADWAGGPGDSYSLERTVKLRGFTGILRVTLRHGDAAGTLAGTATNPATGDIHEFVLERATGGTASSPVPGAGYHTGLLSMEAPLSLRGYLTAKVRPSGLTTLLGALPDGTKVSQTAHVTGAGNLAIFLPAYGKDSAGYLGGSATLTAAGPLPFAGSMAWEKPQGTPRYEGSAWEATPVVLAGAPYVKPSGARVLDDFNATSGAGYVHFSGGSLAAPLTSAVTLETKNHARFAPGDAQKGKLTLVGKTGLFHGSFLHADGKRHTFWGACIQQSGAPDSAQGFFRESDATGLVELTTSATP